MSSGKRGQRDMVSLSPMAEYIDFLYTRLKAMMESRAVVRPRKEPPVEKWWIELHPPESKAEGAGLVRLRALTPMRIITYVAVMHAVQQGAIVGLEELEIVVGYHIQKFEDEINAES